jgi:hypothetical protein
MIILPKTKIFERNHTWWVSVRDYEIKKALDKDEILIVRVGNEYSRYEPWRLVFDSERFTKQTFKTKFKKAKEKEYKLYDLEWNPTERAKELAERELADLEAKKFSEQVL